MAITVITARDLYGAPSAREQFDDADVFSIGGDGHLTIHTRDVGDIAIYAPGHWLSVYVEGAMTVKTEADR
ncbi:MAG: hypothetical protein JWO57_4374 [Pseudonocardiales bacterium]|nr:hypothetical protein [Pseudonocardiales bacterium]